MLPRALDAAIVSRWWNRSIDEVVAIFSNLKGECCSN